MELHQASTPKAKRQVDKLGSAIRADQRRMDRDSTQGFEPFGRKHASTVHSGHQEQATALIIDAVASASRGEFAP